MDIVPLSWKDRLDGCTVGQIIDLLGDVAAELDSRGMREYAQNVQAVANRLFHRWAGIPRPAATESPQAQRSGGGAAIPPSPKNP